MTPSFTQLVLYELRKRRELGKKEFKKWKKKVNAEGSALASDLVSEMAIEIPKYQKKNRKKARLAIKKGFYKNAKEAISAQKVKKFKSRESEWEEFCPLLAFPTLTNKKYNFRKHKWWWEYITVTSGAIEIKGYTVFGIWSDPYQLYKVITNWYKIGGKVIKDAIWDW